MIHERNAYAFCREDLNLIENYDKAIADTTQTWHCHHRDEIRVLPSGMIVRRSAEELQENGRYYNCPANELIFLPRNEHFKIHGLHQQKVYGRKHTAETKTKMSVSHLNGTYSEFYQRFKTHYGETRMSNLKLYNAEYHYFKRTGKCRWEVNDA
jgi:hypothetical protein